MGILEKIKEDKEFVEFEKTLDSRRVSKYEYYCVHLPILIDKPGYSQDVNEKINRYAVGGWEYYNYIDCVIGDEFKIKRLLTLIFRREKEV